MAGPLAGIRVVEFASIGPIPFCGLVLSDLGADVIRVDKSSSVPFAQPDHAPGNVLDRGRRSIAVDLKNSDGLDVVLALVDRADVVIEGYRPGVAERLGVGPAECRGRNPRLVYGRLTGWGRDGPLADRAGHDIDYIALAGALTAFGREGGPPVPPLNLLGDFAGGGQLLALGIACALFERATSGKGQVVDTAMVDGAALLMAPFYAARQIGFWSDARGTNMLDTGSPYYDTYECADGGYMAVGAIEPQFYAELLSGLGLDPADVPDRDDRERWPELRALFARTFKSRTRDEWATVFDSRDACVSPILGLAEAPVHPHNVHRGTFIERDGVIHPAPAPRFDRTPAAIAGPSCWAGQHTDDVLAELGMGDDRRAKLRAAGASGFSQESSVHIAYTPEQEALRADLRAYFRELMTPDVQAEVASGDSGGPACLEAVRKMGRDGWLGIGWPTEYGGQGRGEIEQFIFTDEAWRSGAPIPFLTINTVGKTIMQFGSEEQKQKFLPRILAGECHFSIGYTEPNAGTDLASLRTTAVRDGDEWVINGQKVYTSLASYADYIWLAARTDPDAPKHKGISIFLVPTSDPGFSWTKIQTMVNVSTTSTYYNDVRVGDDAVVYAVNRGWDLITNQLNYERISLAPPGMVEDVYEATVDFARETKRADGSRLADQEWVQINLARVRAKIEYLKLINWKVCTGQINPGVASSAKVFGTEFFTEAYRLLMEVVGQSSVLRRGSPAAALAGRIERSMQGTLILTFGGGTNEVQRDLIALFGLGLPRVPRH